MPRKWYFFVSAQNKNVLFEPDLIQGAADFDVLHAAEVARIGEQYICNIRKNMLMFMYSPNTKKCMTAESAPVPTDLSQPKPVGTIVISNERPLSTAELRDHPVFTTADPEGRVPDVVLAGAPLNPRDRAHHNETRVGIYHEGERVGAFNLKQLSNETWLRDVQVNRDRQGEGLGTASYLGVIAAAHEVGRVVRSDPAGLSPERGGASPARHVWESLVRRGVAEVAEGQDQHGNPRFVSKPPES
jgi:hypothetical protein